MLKQSYKITYSGSSYYVSFGTWSSLTVRTYRDSELIGPDKVRRRSSGMIGMAPGLFREFNAAYGPRAG